MKDNRTQLQIFYRFKTTYASNQGHLDLSLFKFLCGYKKNSKETTNKNSNKTCQKTLSKTQSHILRLKICSIAHASITNNVECDLPLMRLG